MLYTQWNIKKKKKSPQNVSVLLWLLDPTLLPSSIVSAIPEQGTALHDQQCPNLCLSATSLHLLLSK